MIHSINQKLRILYVQNNIHTRYYCDHEHDNFSQTYGDLVSCFRHLTKDNSVQQYITQEVFKTSEVYPANNKPGHDLYVLDIPYHQEFATSQPIKQFKISLPVSASLQITGYTLVLTNKNFTNISDGHRQSNSLKFQSFEYILNF